MQRYHPASCNNAVNSTSSGGPSVRDTSRAESSLSSNFSLNHRRQIQVTSYKLRCEKEALNSRLGPPDFHPPTANCPEETLTREYIQSGYRETVEGLEEAREISLTQRQTFSKPVILKCKESIRKCHRAINESRARKRKEGQVYGVPLSGTLLSKPNIFPEQKACSEDFRKKWIEGLSQPHKRLRLLADHVPHGHKKASLFEVLIQNKVPLLRATWFIKVTYLNQLRPGPSSISSGTLDKIQFSRSEQWTKDVIDYLQYLMDEFVSRRNSHPARIRDRSPQLLYSGSIHHKSDPTSVTVDSSESSLHYRWWYVVRIIQWHLAEGLLLPSLIIDWVLKQLQEKELLGVLQLLLPVIYGVLETAILSQSYVRTLAEVAVRFIGEPSPGGSDLVDNSRRSYTTSAMVEMLRYLILAVPDTFVALNCFPLPSCVVSHVVSDGCFTSRLSEGAGKVQDIQSEAAGALRDKGREVHGRSLSIDCVVSSIQKRANALARAARPGHPGHNVAKVVQALDKTLIKGDITVAYKFIFEDICDRAIDTRWIAEVSPCLRSSLKWIGTVSLNFICSVFLICEWATCDFRDFRVSPPSNGLKFTGRRDFSQLYIAARLLKLTVSKLKSSLRCKSDTMSGISGHAKDTGPLYNYSDMTSRVDFFELKSKLKILDGKRRDLDVFHSPGPLHDILVCWIDQHESHNVEGFKRLQLLIIELTRSGIFYPQVYARQLIISGIIDCNDPLSDQDRRKRHYKILKQLPASYVHDALEEAQVIDEAMLVEAMHVYSNERRLVLCGLINNCKSMNTHILPQKRKKHPTSDKDRYSLSTADQLKSVPSASSLSSRTNGRRVAQTEKLKASISVLLKLPSVSSPSTDTGLDESQGTVGKPIGSPGIRNDMGEGTPGCEECKKVKRQKLSEEPNPLDDEENWWVRKGPKLLESFRPDPPNKPNKQNSRGRQKNVRKTQSLAQLAASRIEGSQGASTSHLCDNRISCPHHRSVNDGDAPKSLDEIGTPIAGDIVSIGKALKQLQFVDKRVISVWLIATLKQLVDDVEKSIVKIGQFNRPFPPVDDRSSVRWKLGEDELSAIMYLMDVSNDVILAARFLLLLLPKALNIPISSLHGGRNSLLLPRNVENHVCAIGEPFILSSLKRYENMLVATDLIPETLSALMLRSAAILASNGRVSGSASLNYARQLLKKYGDVASVAEWERNLKTTYDKRLVSELESGRSSDGFPLGVPAGIEDLDDFLRQKITGIRLSRLGLSMKDIVQRHVDEAFHYFYGKERKLIAAGTSNKPSLETLDDGYQIAQTIVMGLMECIRQTGGAAQEGDPTLVSSAISAIVSSVGQAMSKIPDLTSNANYLSFQSASASLSFARRILRIHITCLTLLKEALGERQSRVFEIALATEASSAIVQVLAPGKNPRGEFQISLETHNTNSNLSTDSFTNSAKAVLTRHAKSLTAVSALVVGVILQGITTLERMVTVFRLKEGLDLIQFVRSMRSSSNGSSRSTFKVDNLVEVSVHWFRVLVGNCRSVCDGFIVELLGEASIVAMSRMQQMLSLSLVFPPAYSIFAFILWRPFIFSSGIVPRDDSPQLYHSLTLAISDVIKHLPFRDVCLRDTPGFYNFVAADATDSDFASMLELSGSDVHLKALAFVPLRARLFLNAIIDCKLPESLFTQDDKRRVPGHGESKLIYVETEANLLDKIVDVLDTLQPAKFHWQWVELRLLLNEQALVEKLEAGDTSLIEAIRSLYPDPDKVAASENENNFIEIILTRLLGRPDAAPFYAEVVRLFGRSLEDSMLLQAKWFLGGHDVLFGRKSIRQRLINIAESKGLSTKAQFWRPWGWCNLICDVAKSKGGKGKFETTSLEEGEVTYEGTESKRNSRVSYKIADIKKGIVCQTHETERALIELVLTCIDQSSDESRNTFAGDLIKQLNNIEQQINTVTCGASKQPGTVSSGIEGSAKSNNRKGARGGSPGLARRASVPTDTVLPSFPALRASMSLRVQFLLRLLPLVCADGEPSSRNMKYMLATVILHLLGSRAVYEDLDVSCNTTSTSSSKREMEVLMDASASVDLSGESLFDRLLLVLHALLSNFKPSWLILESNFRSTTEFSRGFAVFDREVAESLQNDLDRMVLPDTIRWRIQAAMPVLFPYVRRSISCQLPTVPASALASLQPSISTSGLQNGNINLPHRNSVSSVRNAINGAGKNKPSPFSQDLDMDEIDPWTVLEDGAVSGPPSNNTSVIGGGEHANLKASPWLKGAVRVRRMDLTYIGSVDDDS